MEHVKHVANTTAAFQTVISLSTTHNVMLHTTATTGKPRSNRLPECPSFPRNVNHRGAVKKITVALRIFWTGNKSNAPHPNSV